jgi:hypothetical protein
MRGAPRDPTKLAGASVGRNSTLLDGSDQIGVPFTL